MMAAKMSNKIEQATAQRSLQRLRPRDPNGVLVSHLLEASCAARQSGAERGQDHDGTLLLLILGAASVLTLNDLVEVDPDKLAISSGYTKRSVERFFRQAVGDSPAGWLMKARLYGARIELLEAGSGSRVADVGRRRGFAHLARFSTYYRAAFGELPRETLRHVAS